MSKKGVRAPGVEAIYQKHEKSLLSRKIRMENILESKEIPMDFIFHKSDMKLCEWNEPELGIFPLSLNTFKSHKSLCEELRALKEDISKMESHLNSSNNKPNKKTKKETLLSLKNQIKELKRQNSQLTDELIMLRAAYLQLEEIVQHRNFKQTTIRDAIERHHRHKGLTTIISNEKSTNDH